MKKKHPERKKEITPLTEAEKGVRRKKISREVFDVKLKGLRHDIAPGLGCLRNEHLLALLFSPKRQVTPSAAAATTNLYDFCNAVVQVELPAWFYRAYVAGRLVPANKADPDDLPPGATPDCRPVIIGNAERRFATRCYFDDELQQTYNDLLGPVQNGVGIKGGISITAFTAMAAMDAAPGHATIQGDIKNGFNEVQRETMLQETKTCGKLDDTVVFMQTLLEPHAYVGMGKGTSLTTAPFKMSEGTHQGAVESGWYFCMGVNKPFKRANRDIAEHGGGMTAIMDDNYLQGPPPSSLCSAQTAQGRPQGGWPGAAAQKVQMSHPQRLQGRRMGQAEGRD